MVSKQQYSIKSTIYSTNTMESGVSVARDDRMGLVTAGVGMLHVHVGALV